MMAVLGKRRGGAPLSLVLMLLGFFMFRLCNRSGKLASNNPKRGSRLCRNLQAVSQAVNLNQQAIQANGNALSQAIQANGNTLNLIGNNLTASLVRTRNVCRQLYFSLRDHTVEQVGQLKSLIEESRLMGHHHVHEMGEAVVEGMAELMEGHEDRRRQEEARWHKEVRMMLMAIGALHVFHMGYNMMQQ